jgi:hypothetical protein
MCVKEVGAKEVGVWPVAAMDLSVGELSNVMILKVDRSFLR